MSTRTLHCWPQPQQTLSLDAVLRFTPVLRQLMHRNRRTRATPSLSQPSVPQMGFESKRARSLFSGRMAAGCAGRFLRAIVERSRFVIGARRLIVGRVRFIVYSLHLSVGDFHRVLAMLAAVSCLCEPLLFGTCCQCTRCTSLCQVNSGLSQRLGAASVVSSLASAPRLGVVIWVGLT